MTSRPGPRSHLGMGDWVDFNVAMVGATAALAGLVTIAASVNIGEIVEAPAPTARLRTAIAGLVLDLVGVGDRLGPCRTVRRARSGDRGGLAYRRGIRCRSRTPHRRRTRSARPPAWSQSRPASASRHRPRTSSTASRFAGIPDAASVCFALGTLLSVGVALTISWIVLVEVCAEAAIGSVRDLADASSLKLT